jgi:hypothetical protein
MDAPPDTAPAHIAAAPEVFQLHYPPTGDGYTYGSSPNALDDDAAKKAPGVQVRVPLK